MTSTFVQKKRNFLRDNISSFKKNLITSTSNQNGISLIFFTVSLFCNHLIP